MIDMIDERLEVHPIPTFETKEWIDAPLKSKTRQIRAVWKHLGGETLGKVLACADNLGWIAGSYATYLASGEDSREYGDIDVFAHSIANYHAIIERMQAKEYHIRDYGKYSLISFDIFHYQNIQVIKPESYDHWHDPYELLRNFDFLHNACLVVDDCRIAGLHGFKAAIDTKKLVWTKARPWHGHYDKTVSRALKYISRGYDGKQVIFELAKYPETKAVFDALYYFRELKEGLAYDVIEAAFKGQNDYESLESSGGGY
jgi:hypothetical protein